VHELCGKPSWVVFQRFRLFLFCIESNPRQEAPGCLLVIERSRSVSDNGFSNRPVREIGTFLPDCGEVIESPSKEEAPTSTQ